MDIVLGRGRKNVEETLARVTHFKNTGHVSTTVAVVWRTPDSAEAVVVKDLKALLTELVGAEDMRHVVDSQEFLNNLCSKSVPRAAG